MINFDLIDAQGGQIRASAFNATADRLDGMMRVGAVYTIQRGVIKLANSKYNKSGSMYELTLNDDVDVQELPDDGAIVTQVLNLKKLSQIANCNPDDNVDVAGCVIAVGPISTIHIKSSNRDTEKRGVTIADSSQTSIELTLWGENAAKVSESTPIGTVMIVKGARVGDYQGRTLSASYGSQIFLNPQFNEGKQMKQWFVYRC